MRNLSTSWGPGEGKRGSTAGLPSVGNPAHAKYKGLISTPGYCKFSAWKRETEIRRQPFSKLILSSLSSQNPERIWLKDQTTGRSETFGEANRKVANVVASLKKLGIGEGSVVCMWSSNYVEYWLICLSVWELGGIILPVNCLTNTERLLEQLKETESVCMVCDTFNIDQGLNLKEQLEGLKHIILIGEESHEDVVTVSSLMNTPADVKQSQCKFDWDKSPICLMYTTRNGESKVVKHTNKSLTSQVFSPKGASNNWFDQNVGDSLLCAAWFFHFPGLHCFSLCALQGVSMYFLSEYSDQELMSALSDTHVSNCVLYPWQVRMMSQSSQLDILDLSSLKVIITGGSILGPTISRELQERLPSIKFIRESYGLKEAGLLTYNYPKFDKSGPNTVPDDHLMPLGLPNMWTSFKIIDRITGQPVSGPDLQGEICIKTCQMSPGYLTQTGDILDNEGYFHTGDLGYYDKDGVIHFVEHISNMISFWMYEISPSVLESRLLSHSSVADAAVVSVPDKENGQLPRGFVVLKSGHEETEENLINFLESRLQDHERLRGGLFYIQNIPRDENWKVMKNVLEKFVPPSRYEESSTETDEKTEKLEVQNSDNSVAHSPRTQRAVEMAAQLLVPSDNINKEAEEIFGMKSRSRRGSKENILETNNDENKVVDETVEPTMTEILVTKCVSKDDPQPAKCGENSTKSNRDNPVTVRSAAKSGINSVESGENGVFSNQSQGEELSYFLHVTVSSSFLEKKISNHPGVEEALVRGVNVERIGMVPRAYISLKSGFSITGEELLSWINARLEWKHRLTGGIVVVNRIPRDPQGGLLVNLEKFDADVVGMVKFEEKDRYSGPKLTSL